MAISLTDCTYWVHINIPKPVSIPLVFRKLNGGFLNLGTFWDWWSRVFTAGHCYRWLLLGVLNQQLCPPPFILVVLRANQWVIHWWNKKLHLNGVKVYFLCNYQWMTHFHVLPSHPAGWLCNCWFGDPSTWFETSGVVTGTPADQGCDAHARHGSQSVGGIFEKS